MRLVRSFTSLAILAASAPVVAEVSLPTIFTDHMVLQRGVKVPVWGQAAPGEHVTVRIAGHEDEVKAGQDGAWTARVGPLEAGGPFELVIAGSNQIVLQDVMIGEVWLCSGQSNMQMDVRQCRGASGEMGAARFPGIRQLEVARRPADRPQADFKGGRWIACSPGTVGEFSGVAYFFARELHQRMGVPVGLINSAWGGTPVEAWMPRGSFDEADAAPIERYWQEEIEAYLRKPESERQKKPSTQPVKFPDDPRLHQNRPSVLFNQMIHPAIPYAIKGVIWYQGETNVQRAHQYRRLFPALIRGWREAWGQGEFPFLFVQLSNYQAFQEAPGESALAELREAQALALTLPNTAMVVAADVGDGKDCHPLNKQEVGRRLSLAARATAYGETVEHSGPLYASMSSEGARIRLRFTHVGDGLMPKGGKRLSGFLIAGEDRQFVPADAAIDGETVIVSSPQVARPVAVRYAWADAPDCTLWNKAGLPAAPFRTDQWAGVTVGAVRPDDPGAAARGLVRRLLPKHVERFEFEQIPQENERDVFEIETRGEQTVLRGSTAGAMCSALNWYLEHYCRCHVSWLGNQLHLPDPLPVVEKKIRRVSPHRYRYWLNYCAFSYSVAFWDWAQWERFIDWMALHGVNMPLSITGQEATWQAVGRRFGLSDAEIAEFLPGPAYLPFGWMGCLDGWGGPLPASWIEKHAELQKRILARERAFGMMPVQQGFTGHVPAAMRKKFPNAKFHNTRWGGFAPTTFVDPTDPLFREIGKAFIEEQTRLYGTDHFYASDTFVEMMPPSNDPVFLANMGRAVYEGMAGADPEARWVMMGWIFINNARFWQPPQAKAIFGAVPDGRLILLEMGRDKYLETEAYYGVPWIWTTIRNYGNVVELGDNLGDIVGRLNRAMSYSRKGRLCGSGGIMEGLGYDPAVFELVADLNWRDDIKDVEPWLIEVIHHRYGRQCPQVSQAWKLLLGTVYSKPGGDGVIWMRPGLKVRKHARTPIRYDNQEVFKAARLMLEAADEFKDVDTFRYDVTHITRQVLANAARPIYEQLLQANADKDRQRLADAGGRLNTLISDIDTLLATRHEFLLGAWLADAKRWATNEAESRLYEWNARNQVTLWGPPDSRLQGYARKHWSGLLADFYGGRWRLFVQRLDEALASGKAFNADAFDLECQAWEDRWTHARNPFPDEPSGDSIAIARRLLEKYAADIATRPE